MNSVSMLTVHRRDEKILQIVENEFSVFTLTNVLCIYLHTTEGFQAYDSGYNEKTFFE